MSIRTAFDVTMVAGQRKTLRVSAANETEAMEVAQQVRPDWIPISAKWVDYDGDGQRPTPSEVSGS